MTRSRRNRWRRHHARRGATLVELAIVLAIGAILLGTALPRTRAFLDRLAARSATADAAALFERARSLALARWTRVTVSIDSARSSVLLTADGDTLTRLDAAAAHGVRLRASRRSTTYSPLGTAIGVANLTLVATRGRAAETLTVSRLGRVRW